MTIVTLYALFGDDFRMLFFSSAADNTFNILTTISLVSFSIELILSCIAKDEYFLGFYFWLDLVSTASLIMDIGWVMDRKGKTKATKATSLARAGRGARIGTKAGRITRVIRLIRLIRIVKLYKNANSVLTKDDTDLIDEN